MIEHSKDVRIVKPTGTTLAARILPHEAGGVHHSTVNDWTRDVTWKSKDEPMRPDYGDKLIRTKHSSNEHKLRSEVKG